MRRIFILISIIIFLLPELKGQEKNNGFEVKFALIHPIKGHNDYDFSVDPSLELLYFYSLPRNFLISGGLFTQAGKHNWEQLTAHMFYDGWMWKPGRGYYNRQLKYFCIGVPLKIEKKINKFLFNSVFIGFTGGRYFIFDLTDSLGDRVIPVEVESDQLFWDLQLGLTKQIYQSSGLSIGISPIAGARIQHPNLQDMTEYAWYGLSLSARIGK